MHRRTFLAATSALAAAPFASTLLASPAPRALRSISIGVIGCGGRGTGAAVDALRASPLTKISALADLLPERVNGSRTNLLGESELATRVQVKDEDCYSGFDGFRRLLERGDLDAVIVAGPPGFRPMHVEAAIQAGKHVFMEKPVAVDPVGVRRVIAAANLADEKKLCIVAGTQRRHQKSYVEAMQRIASGEIGEIVAARCYWNQGGLWVHQRKAAYSDMEWQCRNWLYFTWLSGDHIVEQHIHNLDVVNWAMGAAPTRCQGVGGRQVRTGAEYGNIYDHFAIEYEYPNGASCLSMCRQIDGCASRVDEVIVGTKGVATLSPGQATFSSRDGATRLWRYEGDNPNPYELEHAVLHAAISEGRHVNEGRRVAESTLTAIMGRMAAYTGQVVSWEHATTSALDLSPKTYEFGSLPVAEVAMPGRTKLV